MIRTPIRYPNFGNPTPPKSTVLGFGVCGLVFFFWGLGLVGFVRAFFVLEFRASALFVVLNMGFRPHLFRYQNAPNTPENQEIKTRTPKFVPPGSS